MGWETDPAIYPFASAVPEPDGRPACPETPTRAEGMPSNMLKLREYYRVRISIVDLNGVDFGKSPRE